MEKAVHKDQIYMKFKDILKKSLLEGLVQRNMGTAQLTTALLVTLLFAVYLFVIYRCMTRSTFYSRSFGISVSAMVLLTAGVLLALQSNFAISLGMVGSLSIVRFRTAVKDPMDTAYMFWALTMGILLGAGQFFLTAVTVVGIAILLTVLVRIQSGKLNSYLLVVRMADGSEKAVAQAVNGLKFSRLKSKTISAAGVEATYEIRVEKHDAFLNKVNAIPGVQDAALVAYTGESV